MTYECIKWREGVLLSEALDASSCVKDSVSTPISERAVFCVSKANGKLLVCSCSLRNSQACEIFSFTIDLNKWIEVTEYQMYYTRAAKKKTTHKWVPAQNNPVMYCNLLKQAKPTSPAELAARSASILSSLAANSGSMWHCIWLAIQRTSPATCLVSSLSRRAFANVLKRLPSWSWPFFARNDPNVTNMEGAAPVEIPKKNLLLGMHYQLASTKPT